MKKKYLDIFLTWLVLTLIGVGLVYLGYRTRDDLSEVFLAFGAFMMAGALGTVYYEVMKAVEKNLKSNS